jgi:hypothetical protein
MFTTKYATQSEALAAHKAITGSEFYEGFHPQTTDSNEWFVCQESGDVYYIWQTEKDNFCQGERIFHKLTIHTSLSNSGFNQVSLFEDDRGAHIHIIERNWSGERANRKVFAKENILVTGLAADF